MPWSAKKLNLRRETIMKPNGRLKGLNGKHEEAETKSKSGGKEIRIQLIEIIQQIRVSDHQETTRSNE